ncbi:hypothetical protein, partial [Endozoicomonas sp. ALC013]|uniref:hypothetical protein n=1 Tax=Endozoicomonas sp. ALC013 TaxID=3403076 RepID=UPI003BB7B62C
RRYLPFTLVEAECWYPVKSEILKRHKLSPAIPAPLTFSNNIHDKFCDPLETLGSPFDSGHKSVSMHT